MTGELTDTDLRRFAAAGMVAMSSAEALELFDAAAATDAATLVTARLDLAALVARAEAGDLHPALRSLVRVPTGGAAERPSDPGSWQRELAGLAEVDQLTALVDLVRSRVAVVLGHPAAAAGTIDPDGPFKDLGFDSLTSVELRNRLAKETGLRLPATLVFDYPTPTDVAAYLRSRLVDVPDADDPVDTAVEHLRQVVATHPLGDAARGHLVNRLKGLVREWTGPVVEPAAALASAGPDELFALLDEQLGSY
jgi:acyl carrier protein